MKSKIKLYLSLIVGFLLFLNSYSQVVCNGDTISLNLAIYRGNLQWQESADSSTWSDISGAIYQPYLIKVTSTKYYRARVTDGTCNLVYSGDKKITVITVPSAPTASINIPSQTLIVWNWSSVSGATGYKWDTLNNYNTAIDNGLDTSYTQTGLFCNTTVTLYVWAYNACGNSKVAILKQNTSVCFTCGNFIIDSRDGQSYNTVLISTQCWTQQNMNIGTRIDGVNDQTNNGIIEKYCYNDDINNCNIYGGLYVWDEMMQYNPSDNGTIGTTQGICPSGWHIPTDAEWTTLTNYLGGLSVAGDKMKETGYSHWLNPNTGATNSSGFTALPGGYNYYYSGGSFFGLNEIGRWWSATEDLGYGAYDRYLGYDYDSIIRLDDDDEPYGFSIRCIKN